MSRERFPLRKMQKLFRSRQSGRAIPKEQLGTTSLGELPGEFYWLFLPPIEGLEGRSRRPEPSGGDGSLEPRKLARSLFSNPRRGISNSGSGRYPRWRSGPNFFSSGSAPTDAMVRRKHTNKLLIIKFASFFIGHPIDF
jgi:hypothetical protein